MTHVTEKKSIEVEYLGLPLSDDSRMDTVALSYEKFAGNNQLSLKMVSEDYYGAAVPLVELIKYAMQHHPELLEEAAHALKNPPVRPSIEELLAKLPILSNFEVLGMEIDALPHPIPKDGRQRVHIRDWTVREAINCTAMEHNATNYVAVIPTAEESGQPVVLEAWGQGMNAAACAKVAFEDLLPGVKNMVCNEVIQAARRIGHDLSEAP